MGNSGPAWQEHQRIGWLLANIQLPVLLAPIASVVPALQIGACGPKQLRLWSHAYQQYS